VDFQHRFTKGIYLPHELTFSKNIDNATNELFSSFVNPRRAQDGFNFANEKGRSALDLTHKLALTFVYDLPNISTKQWLPQSSRSRLGVERLLPRREWPAVTSSLRRDANANGDPAGDRAILIRAL